MSKALYLAAALLAGSAGAAQPSDDLAIITRWEALFGQAFVSGDGDGLERLLDERFVGVGSDGQVYNKVEAIATARAMPRMTFDRVESLLVRFFGDTAVAQGREAEIGPAPELKPRWRSFLDTWQKRGGHWRIIAAQDLDPGSPTDAAYRADEEAIRTLRARSNAAIRAHDMAAFLPMFAEDAMFVWSNGTTASGRSGLQAFFAHDFADPAFVAYVRTPERVSISEIGLRAVEHGTWTALKGKDADPTRYGGDYMAHWYKGAEGWQVRGEVYVKLRCTGRLCTP